MRVKCNAGRYAMSSLIIIPFFFSATLKGQHPPLSRKNGYSHVVTNSSLTTATCLSDGRLSYLSKGDEIQLVARYKDEKSEYNIVKIFGKEEYYMMSSFSENNNSVSLTIKLESNEDPAKSTSQQLTLLKDTTRTDEQNQDFIIPHGKTIRVIFKGKKYSKVLTKYRNYIYCGYVPTKYISTGNFNSEKLTSTSISDSRDEFNFSLVTNKDIIGVYEIRAKKFEGQEVSDAMFEIYIKNGLPKFKILRHKKTLNGKLLYDYDIERSQSAIGEGFVFYDKMSGLFTLGYSNIGVLNISLSGSNTYTTDDLVYTIKKL